MARPSAATPACWRPDLVIEVKACGIAGEGEHLRIALTKIAREKALPFEMRAPNALTAETLAKSERGEDVRHAKNADDLFGQLGI